LTHSRCDGSAARQRWIFLTSGYVHSMLDLRWHWLRKQRSPRSSGKFGSNSEILGTRFQRKLTFTSPELPQPSFVFVNWTHRHAFPETH
jgi:hypothetical protein